MGWFLLRKPYPGLTVEETITIDANELHVGRGRECSVHCLSMYVSRRHLKIIPKESGIVCLLDLGSSNGTFVNQNKIPPGEEFALKLGDEIGIGNINCDSKDCFVYTVRQEGDALQDNSTSPGQSDQTINLFLGPSDSKTSQENDGAIGNSSGRRHSLDRGLKRFATEPEIVTLDDDDEDMFLDESEPKKLKIGEAQNLVHESKMVGDTNNLSVSKNETKPCNNLSLPTNETKSCTDLSLPKNAIKPAINEKKNLEIITVCAMQEDSSTKELDIKGKVPKCDISFESKSAPQIKSTGIKSHSFTSEEKSIEPVKEDNSSKTGGEMKQTGDQMCPPPPPTVSSKIISGRYSFENSTMSMPKNRRLSSLMEDQSDLSSGTLRLSSPSLTGRVSSSSACSTPNTSKHVNPEDTVPVQTSTPCVTKTEKPMFTCTSQTDSDWSPIVKNSSRNSQDSSANYTLDEEMIPVDLSDDEDDEVFPCSQLFAEDDDVKPVLEDLQKEANIIDLSNEDEPEENKMNDNNDLDEIVLISSDEDEDDLKDANRWLMRLSQSSVKVEPIEESIPEEISMMETDDRQTNLEDKEIERHNEQQEMWNIDLDRAEVPVLEKEHDDICDVGKKEKSEEHKVTMPDIKERDETKEKIKEKLQERDKKKDSLKDKDKREKSSKRRNREEKERKPHREKEMKDLERKERKREKSKSTDSDKHRSHSKSHSARKEHKHKNEHIHAKLKEMFPDSDSDDMDIAPNSEHKQTLKSPPSPENLASVVNNIKLHEAQVTLTRIEDDPKTCERFGLHSPVTASSSTLQIKKSVRQTELVPALPMPPRRAINRGISSTTAIKMFEGDKQKPVDSKMSNYAQPKDKKTLRKERLAEVAAHNVSKDKGNSEAKRSAPAKIKITTSNRGSFLVDTDSPARKPKSRHDIMSIKIPKLKDKPVPNLPTKSPLQDMNMSWEKSKPEESAAPPPEPLEIPTGPQPKKRVAQVPPPGFYGDTSAKAPLALPPAPNKSCLSGSSKHNIAMNGAKTTAVKKRVKFKENLVEIREIERLPNTRPVSSSMDADRPKPMSQVSQPPPLMGIGPPAMPTDEKVLEDVIYDISKWNPLWLNEEKNMPSDVLPPVVSNMDLPTIPKTEFLDYKEYYNTMYPLLMLELWTGVSKEYNSNESRKNMVMAVDSATSSAVYLRPDRMLTTLNCHMIVEERGAADHPRLGNLVVIDLRVKDHAEKLVVIPVFGYVSYDTKDRIRQTDQFHKDLVTHCQKPAFKVRFSLMIRERKNCAFVFEKVMRVKNVKYVRGDLRVFQAMKNLAYLQLQYSIISPSAADEDFTLPEVNGHLAFPEQLNETQMSVVLKTAAVCQEEKPKICLIQGPPGTGKSHVIASLVMQLLYREGIYTKTNRERGLVPRVLVCAPSNNAVDLLVRRLLRKRSKLDKQHRFKMVRVGQPQYMQPDVKGVSLQELAKADVVKQDQTAPPNIDIESWNAKLKGIENLMEDLKQNGKIIPQELTFRKADIVRRLRVLEDRCKQQSHAAQNTPRQNFAVEREAMKKILRGADIVTTTLNSCMVKVMENVFPPVSQGKYHFQVCIVDEATQCLEVETLIPLMLGVKTLVLVGDPNQLPATILSKAAREKGLGTSLFARLQKIFPQAPQLLDTQYRMHPEILRWPNKFFYNRRLKTPDSLSFCRESKVTPYAVLSLPFQQDRQGEVNVDEAKLVLQLAEVLINRKAIPSDFRVGIITPYQSQRRAINSMLQERVQIRELVEVNTIDSYQGQEKDVTIISCVRTTGVGFLSDRQRINVALTRAKYAEFICGNFSSLDRDHMWNNLLTDARQRNCFHEIRGPCQNEELWNYVRRKH